VAGTGMCTGEVSVCFILAVECAGAPFPHITVPGRIR